MTACTVKTISPYPIYEIELDKISRPVDISAIVKSFGTEDYVYTFEHNGEIIKHGISVDKNSIPGERIYRQAGHLEGWSKQLAEGSAGDDMREINVKYVSETGKSLSRQGMKITVRDLTKITSPSVTDKHLHVKRLERQLIKEYKETHGKLPIGNVKDESHIDNKTCITQSTWDKFFDFN